jgi:hypothetical protein
MLMTSHAASSTCVMANDGPACIVDLLTVGEHGFTL